MSLETILVALVSLWAALYTASAALALGRQPNRRAAVGVWLLALLTAAAPFISQMLQ